MDLGCETIQIFVKNNNQWNGKPLVDEEVEAFRNARQASPIGPVVAHASYLINLAALNPETLEKSRVSLTDELDRCDRLGLDGLVLHPGAHVGAGETAGIDLVARSLDAVLSKTRGSTPVLLENTAGQGTVLGHDLAQLAEIIERCEHSSRLGVCLDTCHAFAAGYAVHEPDGYDSFWEEVEATVGLAAVRCLHLNDSLKPLASRRDRHANAGSGEMGEEVFRRLMNDPALARVPMILETPRGEDGEGHRRDLDLLRRLRETGVS